MAAFKRSNIVYVFALNKDEVVLFKGITTLDF